MKTIHLFYFLFQLSILTGYTEVPISTKNNLNETNIIDESYRIPVKKSELFVRVVGHVDKPVIIYLHGGPGGFSTLEHEIYRNYLETDYLIIYLDQRGCGQSKDIEDTSLLTIDQYLNDLDSVVKFIMNKYNKKKVNLLGDSWGATYGFLYLLANQSKVNSFISNGGVANGPYAYYNLIEKERSLANEYLKNVHTEIETKKYNDILIALNRIENSHFDDFYNDMTLIKFEFPKLLNFNPYRVIPSQGPPNQEMLKRANVNMATLMTFFQKSEIVNKAFRKNAEYNNLNILDQISSITIPVLVIQGEKDYSIGINQGKMIYDALKTKYKDNKKLQIIKGVGHATTGENPAVVFPIIKDFFDQYN